MSVGGPHFSAVKKAREALKAKANDILDGYLVAIKLAVSAGDYESALKGYQHLLDHMPEEDGERLIDISVDKPKQVDQKQGTNIQIGFALGGIPTAKELPAPVEVTDVKPEPV